jgi:hypothetical protein
MAHPLAAAFEDSSGVRQGRAVEKADVGVSRESSDISESRIAQAGGGHAVVEDLGHLRAATAHHVKPWLDQGAQRIAMCEPGMDSGISAGRGGQSEEIVHFCCTSKSAARDDRQTGLLGRRRLLRRLSQERLARLLQPLGLRNHLGVATLRIGLNVNIIHGMRLCAEA